MVVQMISVGEETGALDKMLEKIANFYDEEVDTAVDTLTSVIEPVMIVLMGGIVGGMVVAMYMPMFKLIQVVVAASRDGRAMPAFESAETGPLPGPPTLAVLVVAVLAAGSGPAGPAPPRRGLFSLEAAGFFARRRRAAGRVRRLWLAALLLERGGERLRRLSSRPDRQPCATALGAASAPVGALFAASLAGRGRPGERSPLFWRYPGDSSLGLDASLRTAPAPVAAHAVSLVLWAPRRAARAPPGRAEAMQHSTARELEQARLDAEFDRRPPSRTGCSVSMTRGGSRG